MNIVNMAIFCTTQVNRARSEVFNSTSLCEMKSFMVTLLCNLMHKRIRKDRFSADFHASKLSSSQLDLIIQRSQDEHQAYADTVYENA